MRRLPSGRSFLRDRCLPAAPAAWGGVRAARPAGARGRSAPSPPLPPAAAARLAAAEAPLPLSAARGEPGGQPAPPPPDWPAQPLVRSRPPCLQGDFSPLRVRGPRTAGKGSVPGRPPPPAPFPCGAPCEQWPPRTCGPDPHRGHRTNQHKGNVLCLLCTTLPRAPLSQFPAAATTSRAGLRPLSPVGRGSCKLPSGAAAARPPRGPGCCGKGGRREPDGPEREEKDRSSSAK